MKTGSVMEQVRDRIDSRLTSVLGLSKGLRGTAPSPSTGLHRDALNVLHGGAARLREEISELRGLLGRRAS